MTEIWTGIRMYFETNGAEYLLCVKEHFMISVLALLTASVIGIPLGYLCVCRKKWERWITGAFQVLRIIPSVAILILFDPGDGNRRAPGDDGAGFTGCTADIDEYGSRIFGSSGIYAGDRRGAGDDRTADVLESKSAACDADDPDRNADCGD